MHIGLTVLRSQEKIKKLSFRELLSALWMIASVTVAYLLRLDVSTLVVLCIIGDFILLVWTMGQIGIPFPILSPISAISNVKKYFSYTAPLIINSLFLWFTKSIDRFLIVHLIGLASMGLYGVSLQVAGLLSVVLSPINFVLFPRATASWKPDRKDEAGKYFSQALTMTLIFSAPVIVGLLAVSGGLIPLLAGPGYASTTGLIFFLLISVLSTMVYQNHLYVIHLVEKTYFLPILFIVTAVLNYALGYFLISKYSLFGAGLARCMTSVVMAAIISIWAKKYIKFSLPWVLIIKTFTAALLMGVMIYLLPTHTWKQLIVATLSGVLIYVLLLIIFRVITRETFVKLRNAF
jgi:O-antigen/teichoic acid export membrane protein